MKQLEEIKARAGAATNGPWELAGGNEWLSPLGVDVGSEFESNRPTLSARDAEFIAAARTDVPKLAAALDAIVAWCDLLQYPTTDYPEGFSSQDYALDDAARRVRAMIIEALEAA